MSYPVDVKRHTDDNDKAKRMIAGEPLHRASGGRVHHRKHHDDIDDDTASHNIHIVVNGKPQDQGMVGLAGLGAAPPPMSPPPPPMGAPPMPMGGGLPGPGGPPPPMGAGTGPGPIAMRRGGRAKKDWGGAVAQTPAEAEGSGQMVSAGKEGAPVSRKRGGGGVTHAQSKTDGDKFHPDHGTDTTPAKKARGGSLGQLDNASGGAGGGLGRLRKAQVARESR